MVRSRRRLVEVRGSARALRAGVATAAALPSRPAYTAVVLLGFVISLEILELMTKMGGKNSRFGE